MESVNICQIMNQQPTFINLAGQQEQFYNLPTYLFSTYPMSYWESYKDQHSYRLLSFKNIHHQNIQFKDYLSAYIHFLISQNTLQNPQNQSCSISDKDKQEYSQKKSQQQQKGKFFSEDAIQSKINSFLKIIVEKLNEMSTNQSKFFIISEELLYFTGKLIEELDEANSCLSMQRDKGNLLNEKLEQIREMTQIKQAQKQAYRNKINSLEHQLEQIHNITYSSQSYNQLSFFKMENSHLKQINEQLLSSIHTLQNKIDFELENMAHISKINCRLRTQNEEVKLELHWSQKNRAVLEGENKQLHYQNQQLRKINIELQDQINSLKSSFEVQVQNQSQNNIKSSSTKYLSKSFSRNSENFDQCSQNENQNQQPQHSRDSIEHEHDTILYRVKSLQSIQSSVELFNLRDELQCDNIYSYGTKIQTTQVGIMTDLYQSPSQANQIMIPSLNLSNLSTSNPHKKKQFVQQVTDLSTSLYIESKNIRNKNFYDSRITDRIRTQNSQVTSRSFLQQLVHKRVSKPRLNESIAEIEQRQGQQSFLGKLNSSMTDRLVKKRIKGMSCKNESEVKKGSSGSVLGSFKKMLIDKRIKR